MKKIFVSLFLLCFTLFLGGCKMSCKNHTSVEHNHNFVNGICECGVKENNLYTLQEAFDSGYLTHRQLKQIAFYKNSGIKYPIKLNSNVENQIIEDFCKMHGRNANENEGSVRYFGKYNGCRAVMVDGCGIGYLQCITSETIDGVNFHYSSSQHMLVWRNN